MRVFLDTSYFLDLINLTSPSVEERFLVGLLSDNDLDIYYSTITIFELQALAAKHIANKEIEMIDALKGIQSLLLSTKLNKIEFYSSLMTQLAMELRTVNMDFIDCVIMASAINKADTLITEDTVLKELMVTDYVKQLLDRFNAPHFSIISSNEWVERNI